MELKRRMKRKLKALMGSQTQEVFASKIGVTQTTLNRLLKGDHNIGINTIEKICKFSGLQIEELLGCNNESDGECIESDKQIFTLKDGKEFKATTKLETNSTRELVQS